MGTSDKTDIAVIGAGPAGLAAAVECARTGARTVVFDENLAPGGQLFKQIHKFFGSREHLAGTRGFRIGEMLLDEARKSGVEIRLGTVVQGIFDPLTLALTTESELSTCQARAIIVATGAIENTLAFPGWTLPGVMGAGAAQTMVNVNRVLPGRRVLMVGSGNVGLIVTYQLLQAGAEVVAIVEALDRIGGYAVHSAKIRRAGVPVLLSHTIKEAHGRDRVEGVTSVRVDGRFRPVAGSEVDLDADTVCIAVGLSPLSELLLMLGVQFAWDSSLGGHIPLHGRDLETTKPGVYVAGDVAGVEEASCAMEEGRLAGIGAAQYVDAITAEEARARKAGIRERLDTLRSGTFGSPRRQAKDLMENRFASPACAAACGSCRAEAGHAGDAGTPEATSPRSAGRGISATGYPSEEELVASPGYPSFDRMLRGPVAVIECVQDIPCNPCEEACPSGAIKVGRPITNLPVLDEDKCTGCGLCIPSCPGLAVFNVDISKPGEEAFLQFPWEYLPAPQEGEVLDATDRSGEVVAKARVVRVRKHAKSDRTLVVEIALPKQAAMQVRGTARRRSRE